MKKEIMTMIALLAVVSGAMAQNVSCPNNNHPHLIDLGLPSGTKWACCNMGAPNPYSFGDEYAWGETEKKSNCTEENYKWRGSDIGRNISGTEYDVAHVKLGSPWRLPTKEEINELIDKCQWKFGVYIEEKGVYGAVATGPNNKKIFFPYEAEDQSGFDGYATASSPKNGETMVMFVFDDIALDENEDGEEIFVGEKPALRTGKNYYGRNIRPVYKKDK